MTDETPKPEETPKPDEAPKSDAAPTPDAAPNSNPSGGSASSSSCSTSSSSYTSKESPPALRTPRKKPPLWSYPNGKPAPWRVDNRKVKGLVRRKGDLNPLNWALYVDKEILNHPRIGEVRTQVDLAKEEKACEGCGKRKGRENMGCLVM
jgi:hypothetical protein